MLLLCAGWVFLVLLAFPCVLAGWGLFGIANMKFEFAVQDAIKNPQLKPHRPETLSRREKG